MLEQNQDDDCYGILDESPVALPVVLSHDDMKTAGDVQDIVDYGKTGKPDNRPDVRLENVGVDEEPVAYAYVDDLAGNLGAHGSEALPAVFRDEGCGSEKETHDNYRKNQAQNITRHVRLLRRIRLRRIRCCGNRLHLRGIPGCRKSRTSVSMPSVWLLSSLPTSSTDSIHRTGSVR